MNRTILIDMTRTLPLMVAALLLSACGSDNQSQTATDAPVANKACTKTVSGATFVYRVIAYANGDDATTCKITPTSTGTSYFGSNFCTGGQAGGTGGPCQPYDGCNVTYDVDTVSASGGGVWLFERHDSVYQATYKHTGSASDGMVVTFAAADCPTTGF